MKTPDEGAAPETPKITIVPQAQLWPWKDQPRTFFSAEQLAELRQSLQTHGFLAAWPILARPLEYAWNKPPEGVNRFILNYRTHHSNPWLPVAGDFEFPANAAWKFLTSEKDVAHAIAWLPKAQIIDGERRWRESGGLGIADVPVVLREMTDAEALELALISALQKAELRPLEEALGFHRMLHLSAEGGKSMSSEDLSKKIGKSIRHIERRVKLRVLANDDKLKDFVKAWDDKVIGSRHALLVASIPDAKARAKFAEEIIRPKYDEAPLSVRKAEALRQRDYMIDLRSAPFNQDNALLVEVKEEDGRRVMGGACKDCPLRAGNAPELFEGEIPSGMANLCLNPSCFELKKQRSWEVWQAANTDPKKKTRALDQAECVKLYPHGDQLHWSSGYVDLEEKPDTSHLLPGVESPGKWKTLIKGGDMEIVVAKDRNGKEHRLVKTALAIASAIENEHKCFKGTKENPTADPNVDPTGRHLSESEIMERRQEEVKKSNDEHEIKEAIRYAQAAALAERAGSGKPLPDGLWIILIGTWLENYAGDSIYEMEDRRGWDKDDISLNPIKKLKPHHQVGALVELLFWVKCETSSEADLLKVFKIDVAAITKQTAKAVKDTQKRRAELRTEIDALCEQGKIQNKDLNEIIKVLFKKEEHFMIGTIKIPAELEKLRDEIKKRVTPKAAPAKKAAPAAKAAPAKPAAPAKADGKGGAK